MSVSPAEVSNSPAPAWFPSKVDYADEILDMRKCGMAKPDVIAWVHFFEFSCSIQVFSTIPFLVKE